jgi:hypothetical protein
MRELLPTRPCCSTAVPSHSLQIKQQIFTHRAPRVWMALDAQPSGSSASGESCAPRSPCNSPTQNMQCCSSSRGSGRSARTAPSSKTLFNRVQGSSPCKIPRGDGCTLVASVATLQEGGIHPEAATRLPAMCTGTGSAGRELA